MRFSLDAEQLAFRDAVRDLLAGPDATGQWAGLAAMGLFGALVPEPAGGLGLSDVDIVPVLVELGSAAGPDPVAETAAVAAPLLAAAGHPVAPVVAAGERRVALAGPTGLVPYGTGADLVLVLDAAGARLVRPAPGPIVATVDVTRGLTRPDLTGGELVTTEPGALRRAALRAELATAAQQLGLGRRMLELTTAYVRTRHQFGVPVGSFQAVKHHLATALLRLEFAEPAVLAAGWHLTEDDADAPRAVALAAILAGEAATGMARTAIQCHGAIGYTVEYELHRYAKRAWALAASGDTGARLDRIATSLRLGGAPA